MFIFLHWTSCNITFKRLFYENLEDMWTSYWKDIIISSLKYDFDIPTQHSSSLHLACYIQDINVYFYDLMNEWTKEQISEQILQESILYLQHHSLSTEDVFQDPKCQKLIVFSGLWPDSFMLPLIFWCFLSQMLLISASGYNEIQDTFWS